MKQNRFRPILRMNSPLQPGKRFFCILCLLIGTVVQAQTSLKLPPYSRTKLPNGMILLLMEQHEVPIISFSVLVRAGAVADPAGKEGLASLTAELLRRGTRS